jgi:hypothetical protein
MVNHARTLLLNLAPAPTGYSSAPGEEFIEPDFRPLQLPGYLQHIRNVLFGSDPDRLMLNYRGRQLLGLLHTTELVEFVLELDSRITYDTLPRDAFYASQFLPRVTRLRGTTAELPLSGRVGPPDRAGRLEHAWRVETASSSQVAVRRLTAPLSLDLVSYTLTSGLSELLDLPGSGLQFRVPAGVGNAWRITACARPEQNLAELVTSLTAVAGPLETVFGVGTAAGRSEPFVTFRNLWRDHPEALYRLGGALLGYIYRADALYRLR